MNCSHCVVHHIPKTGSLCLWSSSLSISTPTFLFFSECFLLVMLLFHHCSIFCLWVLISLFWNFLVIFVFSNWPSSSSFCFVCRVREEPCSLWSVTQLGSLYCQYPEVFPLSCPCSPKETVWRVKARLCSGGWGSKLGTLLSGMHKLIFSTAPLPSSILMSPGSDPQLFNLSRK